MRKINLLGLIFLIFALSSCNSETPESTATNEVEDISEVGDIPGNEKKEIEVPSFESIELTEFAGAFNDYMNKAIVLLKAGDMKGLEQLKEEGKALQDKGAYIKDNVSEDDKALLEDYLKIKAMEMLSASGLDQLGDKIEKSLTKE
ncbi:MAG: hypothetical protein QNK51_06030 [Chitinophagales bacterium]